MVDPDASDARFRMLERLSHEQRTTSFAVGGGKGGKPGRRHPHSACSSPEIGRSLEAVEPRKSRSDRSAVWVASLKDSPAFRERRLPSRPRSRSPRISIRDKSRLKELCDHAAHPFVGRVVVETFVPMLFDLYLRKFDRWLEQLEISRALKRTSDPFRHRDD